MGGAQPAPPLLTPGVLLRRRWRRAAAPGTRIYAANPAARAGWCIAGGGRRHRGIPSSALFEQFRFGSASSRRLMRAQRRSSGAMDARVHRRSAAAPWPAVPRFAAGGGGGERAAFLAGFGAATLALSGLDCGAYGSRSAPCRALYHRRLLWSDGGRKSAVGRRPLAAFLPAWLFWECGAR
ncbi:hypothetical protein M8494_25265 [Serratia ureilytica]